MASFQRSHAKHPCTGAAIDRHHPPPHSACWRASSHSCLKAPAGRAGSSLKGAGMYYPIAEEELQVVQDCMQQISLLVDLGSGISAAQTTVGDRKITRLNSSHLVISYAVFCLKKKKNEDR